MHVPASTAGQTCLLPENLRSHLVQVNTFGDRLVVWPVGGGDDITSFKMRANPNGHGLLAIAQVHLSRNRTICHCRNIL